MTVISLKDYAKEHNITYEAVRKQVARFKADLEGHIIQDGRQQLLDEEAVAFLNARRDKNPIAIIQQDKDDTIAALESENQNLLQQIVLLQAELLQEKNQRIELSEKANRMQFLAERAGEYQEKVKELTEDLIRQKRESAMNARRASEAEGKILSLRERNFQVATDLDREKKKLETAEKIAEEREREIQHVKEKMIELQKRFDRQQIELKELREQGLWDRIWNRKRK